MKKNVWKVSLEDSSVQVKVKYMGISSILASFLKFKGEVLTERFFKKPEIYLELDVGSVSTLDDRLDKYIKSPSFLCAKAYPILSFTSLDGCNESPGGISELNGVLFIKGIKKSITLIINFSDLNREKNPLTACFNLFAKINLSDFDIAGNFMNDLEDDFLLNATICLKRLD